MLPLLVVINLNSVWMLAIYESHHIIGNVNIFTLPHFAKCVGKVGIFVSLSLLKRIHTDSIAHDTSKQDTYVKTRVGTVLYFLL